MPSLAKKGFLASLALQVAFAACSGSSWSSHPVHCLRGGNADSGSSSVSSENLVCSGSIRANVLKGEVRKLRETVITLTEENKGLLWKVGNLTEKNQGLEGGSIEQCNTITKLTEENQALKRKVQDLNEQYQGRTGQINQTEVKFRDLTEKINGMKNILQMKQVMSNYEVLFGMIDLCTRVNLYPKN
jgi:hypothetical protein